MTSNIVSGSLAVAVLAPIAVGAAGVSADFGIAELLEAIQSGASVAAVMGMFLWREIKKNEKYDVLIKDLRDENKKLYEKINDKCSNCPYTVKARENLFDSIEEDKK